MRTPKNLMILCLLLFSGIGNSLYSATLTSAQSGYFSVPSTWVGGAAPAYGDNIIIASGHTVTLDLAATVMSITIQTGATLDNGEYNLTMNSDFVGNPIYTNNGTHNGTGNLIAYNNVNTWVTGNGTTNCNIEIPGYGLTILNTCNLTINGNIEHSVPGNFGMNGKEFLGCWQIGSNLTVNGDLITDEQYMVGIIIVAGSVVTVNGNVSLSGGLSSGSGSNITNNGTFNISGDLSLGPYSGYCQNSGTMSIGGDLLGGGLGETYFLQEANSTVTFGGSVFPDAYNGELLTSGLSIITFAPVEPNFVEYNGSTGQIIKLASGGIPYSFLTINNNSADGVMLNSDISVSGGLSLNNGLLSIGDFNLTIEEAASISGNHSAGSMIVAAGLGELRKVFSAPGSFTFPVGDNDGVAEYSPVTLNFTSGSFSGAYAGVSLVNAAWPGVTGSYLNRYWNVTSTGITDYTCNAQFDYVQDDVNGTESELYCFRVSPSINQYNHTDVQMNQLTANDLISLGTFTGKQADNSTWPMAYTVTGSGSYCEGDDGIEVGLSGSEPNVTYTLYKDGVAQSPAIAGTGQAISFGNQLYGTYTIDGTNNNGTTQMTGNAVIIENLYVTPSVTISTEAGEVCEGTEVTYIASAVYGGEDPVYQWFVNGVESGENNITLTYTSENNDLILLLLTSGESCTVVNPVQSNELTAVVNVLPDVFWPFFEQDTLCEDWEPVLLSGGIPEGGTYSGIGVTNNTFNPAIAGPGTHDIIYTFTD
ncbi:MAG: hypothetical protein CVT94_17455, partial [Bacteroidetes bacterium HGW-Bacteroidetes-11]